MCIAESSHIGQTVCVLNASDAPQKAILWDVGEIIPQAHADIRSYSMKCDGELDKSNSQSGQSRNLAIVTITVSSCRPTDHGMRTLDCSKKYKLIWLFHPNRMPARFYPKNSIRHVRLTSLARIFGTGQDPESWCASVTRARRLQDFVECCLQFGK